MFKIIVLSLCALQCCAVPYGGNTYGGALFGLDVADEYGYVSPIYEEHHKKRYEENLKKDYIPIEEYVIEKAFDDHKKGYDGYVVEYKEVDDYKKGDYKGYDEGKHKEHYHKENYHKGDYHKKDHHNPYFKAAIKSHHTIESKPVHSEYHKHEPVVVDIDAGEQPVKMNFHSRSSPIHLSQKHHSQPGSHHSEKSADAPHILTHEVLRPVIQEVREIIVPQRVVVQEIKPVVEEVKTVVHENKGHVQGYAPAHAQGYAQAHVPVHGYVQEPVHGYVQGHEVHAATYAKGYAKRDTQKQAKKQSTSSKLASLSYKTKKIMDYMQ